MNYYTMQGPAQYAQYQQSRQDQRMNNILQMMMQSMLYKQKLKQWEQERTTQQEQWQREQERKEASTNAYVKHLENLAKQKPKPTLLDLRTRTANEMVSKGEWTLDEGRRYSETGKEPQRIPPNLPKGFQAYMTERYGDDWTQTVDYSIFADEWEEHQETVREKGSQSDSVAEIRRYWNRQRNTIKQQWMARIASAAPDEQQTLRQGLADALEAMKKSEQEEIDILKGKVKSPKDIAMEKIKEKETMARQQMESVKRKMGAMGGATTQGVKAQKVGNNVVINGNTYPINPDGTVIINGKKFKIE